MAFILIGLANFHFIGGSFLDIVMVKPINITSENPMKKANCRQA